MRPACTCRTIPQVPTRWQIPLNNKSLTTVPAGGFLLIWADDDATAPGLHAGFNLDAEGDTLYLFDTDGSTLLDSVEFGEQIPNISYGRYPDATGDWSLLNFPTPGMSNAPAASGVVSDLEFSHGRGFYESPFELTISCETPERRSITPPTAASPTCRPAACRPESRTPQPIRITRTTCLRAIAVKPDWVPTRMETQTYIFLSNVAQQTGSARRASRQIGADVAADYEMDRSILSNPQYGGQLESALLSLPSMSIVMTNRDLFDTQTGIYANSGSSGAAWERPCSIE